MSPENSKALIVAYFLSRFDRDGLQRLGYKTFQDAFEAIGERLGVKPKTISNMRDEFDPYHYNSRKGWHQRPLSPSRVRVLESFQHMDFSEIFEIVKEIIGNSDFEATKLGRECSLILQNEQVDDSNSSDDNFSYSPRGRTGQLAEEYFMNYFTKYSKPVSGVLEDKRLDGCGYDFEICRDEISPCFIEVKGDLGTNAGLLFTSKEWDVAKQARKNYCLCTVRNLAADPTIHFLFDPFSALVPKRNIQHTIAINYSLSSRQLNAALNEKIKKH